MILLFPDKPTLQLAITSGLLPVEVASAPCEFAGHEDGRVWVKSKCELEKSRWESLKPLGIKFRKTTRGSTSDIAIGQLLAADSAVGKNLKRKRFGRTHAGAV